MKLYICFYRTNPGKKFECWRSIADSRTRPCARKTAKGDHSKQVSPSHRQPSLFSLARARACNPVRYTSLRPSDARISFFHAIYTHSARTRARVGRTFLACSCHLKRVRHVNRTCYARRASTAISSISVANCRVRLAFQEYSGISVAESRLSPRLSYCKIKFFLTILYKILILYVFDSV